MKEWLVQLAPGLVSTTGGTEIGLSAFAFSLMDSSLYDLRSLRQNSGSITSPCSLNFRE